MQYTFNEFFYNFKQRGLYCDNPKISGIFKSILKMLEIISVL